MLDTQSKTRDNGDAHRNGPQTQKSSLVSSSKSTEHQVEEEAAEVSPCADDAHDFPIVDGIDEGDDGERRTAHMLHEEAEKYHDRNGDLQRNEAVCEADQESALEKHGEAQRQDTAR